MQKYIVSSVPKESFKSSTNMKWRLQLLREVTSIYREIALAHSFVTLVVVRSGNLRGNTNQGQLLGLATETTLHKLPVHLLFYRVGRI